MAPMTLALDLEHREPYSRFSESRILYAQDRITVPGIVTFGYQRAKEKDESFPLHYHRNRYEFHYLMQGSLSFVVGGESYTMKAGDVFITQPNELHKTGDQTIIRQMYWFSISDEVPLLGLDSTRSHALLAGLKSLKHRVIPMNPSAEICLKESYRHITSPDAVGSMVAAAQMVSFLSSLIESDRQLTAPSLSAEIQQALNFIQKNRHHQLSLDQVAEHCHLSVSYFKHRFKDEMGVTPAFYIQTQRIECAKEILKSGKSVTETAYELDFASSNYFSVVFRRITLMTPTQYLQKIRQADPEE